MAKLRRARPLFALLMLAIGCTVAHGQQSATAQPPSGGQLAASQQQANIVFVDATAVTLPPDSSGAFKLDTAVKNSGGNAGTPLFNLRGVEDAKCNKESLVPNPAIGSMPANAAEIAHFSIADIEIPATCYIEMVTKGQDGEIKNTSLKQIKLSQKYATMEVMWALLVCLVVSVVVMIVTRIAVKMRFGPLPEKFKVGGPAWEFAKSWSSTLTLAGATVTAALALSALPELTKNASKSGYAIMALLIALLVVVAPLSFVIFRQGEVVEDEETKKESVVYTGGLFAFFLSCTITLFAGLAQLLVLFLLGDELFRDYGIWSWVLVRHEPWWFGLGSILIVSAAVTLCAHTLLSMRLTIGLELANRRRANGTKGNLEMIKARASARVSDLNWAIAEMTKPDDGSKGTVESAVKQAADYLEWANNKAFRAGNDHQNDQAKLMDAASHLNVDLRSAANSRPPRSWPIL